jgi:chromosome segregation ATPase
MNLKRGLLWACIVALLAAEFFLFSANRQKEEALAQIGEARHEAREARANLEQLTVSNVDSQNAEISRLRAENLDMPRLRNLVTQLQAANRKLTQQLQATNATVQQQQDELQQLQTENQQAREAVHSAAAIFSAEAQQRNACINNLRQIDAAKQQWALENNKTAAAVPTVQDLLPYFKNGIFPVCPSGGTYTIGAVGEAPTCSVPGHVLPQ